MNELQSTIEDFDETQLKSLLDEAMDYKSPRDANDKSETFKVSNTRGSATSSSISNEIAFSDIAAIT